jgi:hypothetical protein
MADQQQPISRRRLLKRLGAGTAVVWSAPVLSSMRTPAYAQASPTCFPAFCGPRFEFCGPESTCPLPPGCAVGICSVMNDNSCLCWDFAFCTCPNPVCQSDADCGAGLKCGPTEPDCDLCCGRTACYHPCGTSGSAPRGQGVRVVRAADVRR